MSQSTSQPRNDGGQWSSKLHDSLKHQLREKGHGRDAAHSLATEILVEQGAMTKEGRLTALGREREAMGRAGRRVERHARQTGHDESEIGYRAGKAFVK